MLWVVMNVLGFVRFGLMVCWNLHMPGVEIYTFSVNIVLMIYWNLHSYHMARIEIYTSHGYLGVRLSGKFEHKM